ncbi:hypothetical protein QTP86_016353 [Hemibagrus guttatus]|nr:hypothetical protein QTP86_016353 [Hemibagrus guttatus]
MPAQVCGPLKLATDLLFARRSGTTCFRRYDLFQKVCDGQHFANQPFSFRVFESQPFSIRNSKSQPFSCILCVSKPFFRVYESQPFSIGDSKSQPFPCILCVSKPFFRVYESQPLSFSLKPSTSAAPAAPGDESGSVSSLPLKLKKTIPLQDQRWIASTLFHGGRLRPDLQLWYEPPVPSLIYHQAPTPGRFFTHRLFVWMPYHQWKVRLFCPVCGKQLSGADLHKRACRVLDIDRYYLMVTETLRCTVCHVNYFSTSQTVLNQLDLPHQRLFRPILTYKYACDIRVIHLMRERTLGNSPTRLAKQLKENHGEEWLNRLAHYEPPEPIEVPTSKWLLSVYVKDIMRRLDHVKERITSKFGNVLKLDLRRKIIKKLSGHAQGTAQWLSSFGNERGEILISVLTAQEGPGLDSMASGLIRGYQLAGVAPPVLLYADHDCCTEKGQSKLQTRFKEWPNLNIRLDIWHFMTGVRVHY